MDPVFALMQRTLQEAERLATPSGTEQDFAAGRFDYKFGKWLVARAPRTRCYTALGEAVREHFGEESPLAREFLAEKPEASHAD